MALALLVQIKSLWCEFFITPPKKGARIFAFFVVFSHFYKSPVFATNRHWIRYKSPSYPDPKLFEFSRKNPMADVAPLFKEGSRCIDCPGDSTCLLGYKSP